MTTNPSIEKHYINVQMLNNISALSGLKKKNKKRYIQPNTQLCLRKWCFSFTWIFIKSLIYFSRLIGLVSPIQRELLEKKRNERRKRSTTSTNRNDFLYGSYEMLPVSQHCFPMLFGISTTTFLLYSLCPVSTIMLSFTLFS